MTSAVQHADDVAERWAVAEATVRSLRAEVAAAEQRGAEQRGAERAWRQTLRLLRVGMASSSPDHALRSIEQWLTAKTTTRAAAVAVPDTTHEGDPR